MRQELAEAQAAADQEVRDAEQQLDEEERAAVKEAKVEDREDRRAEIAAEHQANADAMAKTRAENAANRQAHQDDIAAEHQAKADAREEARADGQGGGEASSQSLQAAKQDDTADKFGYESSPTQSCEVWADPPVGFNPAYSQGKESVVLIALNSATDLRARFTYGGSGSGDIANSCGMSTFDKRTVDLNAYDTGDFWLVKSDPVHIQGRFRLSGEFTPDKAAIGAVAVGGPFMQGHTLVVEPLDGTISFDGKVAPVGSWSQKTEDGHGPVDLVSLMDDGHGFVLAELPMGITLFFRRSDKHVDIKITMPKLDGSIDGECGNFDGIAANDVENDIQDRMGGLKIDSPEMLLFDKPFNQSEPLLTLSQ